MKAFTDIEQSKKLAEILPIESADMCFNTHGSMPPLMTPYTRFKEFFNMEPTPSFLIPCWSLAALLEAMPKGEGKDLSLVFGSYDGGYHPLWFCTYEETPTILEICSADNPVDACYEMIYKLNKIGLL